MHVAQRTEVRGMAEAAAREKGQDKIGATLEYRISSDVARQYIANPFPGGTSCQ